MFFGNSILVHGERCSFSPSLDLFRIAKIIRHFDSVQIAARVAGSAKYWVISDPYNPAIPNSLHLFLVHQKLIGHLSALSSQLSVCP